MSKFTYPSFVLLAVSLPWQGAFAAPKSNFDLPPGFAPKSNFDLPPGFVALDAPEPPITETAIQPPPSTSGQTATPATPATPAGEIAPKPETSNIPPAAVPTENFTLKLSSSSDTYQIGKTVNFVVESSRECDLTVIDIGASGNIAVVFPNAYQRTSTIKTGKKIRIPDSSSPFDIKVSAPIGVERVIAICRTGKQALFNTPYNFDEYDFKLLTANWEQQTTPAATGEEARAEISFTVTK
jgi:hypothetical protein